VEVGEAARLEGRGGTASVPEVGGEPMQHLLMAACVMSMVPIILMFFFGQRFFVQGIVMSGIKG